MPRILLALGLATIIAGCATQVDHHGQIFSDNDLQQVQPGMSKEQVQLALGSPNTTSTVGGQTYYYISSTTKQGTFTAPKEIDRRVVAVYFNPLGSVDRVANYGLKDGVVFDYISRETPTKTADRGLIGNLFRGVGRHKKADDGSVVTGPGSPFPG